MVDRSSGDSTVPPSAVVEEMSIAEIQFAVATGAATSVGIVQAYLDRIAAIDAAGPSLHCIIAINRNALRNASAADAARAPGSLAGIPVLIKDNIECVDGMATTAGSLALKNNVSGHAATLVRRLTDSGAIILGKTNLSEWANFRSSNSISGWSAMGGLSRSPYVLDRSPGGSSSGTAVAIAASLAAAGVGTETDGSIVVPASLNGLVGLKPTVGLVSRNRVVPISYSQDTPGPMARCVADVAALLTAMAGSDPEDPATAEADRHRVDYLSGLSGVKLSGVRLGVLRYASNLHPQVDVLFSATLERLRAHGANIIEITNYRPDPIMFDAEDFVLSTEFKAGLNAYLAASPPSVETRSLRDVIAFNIANARELCLFGQDLFEIAEQTRGLSDPDYLQARSAARRLAAEEGIDLLIARDKLDALVAPTWPPARRVDILGGRVKAVTINSLPAIAGYPHLTVPMGEVLGLPVGFSFVGTAWSDAALLSLGAAFESAVQGRRPPTYVPSLEAIPPISGHLTRPI